MVEAKSFWVIIEEICKPPSCTNHHSPETSVPSHKASDTIGIKEDQISEIKPSPQKKSSSISNLKSSKDFISKPTKISPEINNNNFNWNRRDLEDFISLSFKNSQDIDEGSYYTRENEVLNSDHELELNIKDRKIGKKVGRPRKNPRISHFFEFRRKIKKNGLKPKSLNDYAPQMATNQVI